MRTYTPTMFSTRETKGGVEGAHCVTGNMPSNVVNYCVYQVPSTYDTIEHLDAKPSVYVARERESQLVIKPGHGQHINVVNQALARLHPSVMG